MTDLKRPVAPFKVNGRRERTLLAVTPGDNVSPIKLKISTKQSARLALIIGYKFDLMLRSERNACTVFRLS